MDEATGSEFEPPRQFNWHIPHDELLRMPENERIAYLNEKTSRLYDALSALVAGAGRTTPEELDRLLNPEKYAGQEDRSED